MRVSAAAFMNQPPMWLSTASLKMRSRPIRVSRTRCGTLPLRKPGILTERARSEVACSTACRRSACGTSTLSRTRLSGSSSTCVAITRPIQAKGLGLPVRALPVVRLAVVVVEVLKPRHQADAAEVDLVRARVPNDVVRLAGAVGEVGDPVGAGNDRMRDPSSRRPGDDVARTEVMRLGLAPRVRRRRPELQRPGPLEHDERLGLLRVAVRWAAALRVLAADPVQARALRAGGRGEHLVAVFVEGHVVERDDVVGPLPGLGELEVAHLGLDIPGVVHAPLDPRVAEPDRSRTRQPPVLDRVTGSEDEVVEPIRASLERVLEVVGDLNDRVAGANLEDGLVLPEQPRAAEDVVDLLGTAVRVRRRREPAGLNPHTIEADPLRAGRVAEPLPGRGHRALLVQTTLNLAPVRQHEPSIPGAGGGIRTLKLSRAPAPKTGVSASSTTPAFRKA